MNYLKLFFFPLLLIIQTIYLIFLFSRNFFYDLNILSEKKKNVSIISVGSLKLGGAGKTPLVEYLIKNFNNTNLAVLSRGYKRNTKGFLLANKNHSSEKIGDEPLQIINNNPDLLVAVCENRVNGVEKLITFNKNLKTVILDDGFQHRSLFRNLNILVTEYDFLYCNDSLFPLGNLREYKAGSKRADIIVITKCPKKISEEEKIKIKNKLSVLENQKIFFSFIRYKSPLNYLNNKIETLNIKHKYFLLTGIGNSKPLLNYLSNNKIKFSHFKYSDHHNFKEIELKNLIQKGKHMKIEKLILTEKDFYRLGAEKLNLIKSYFDILILKIEFDFINEEKAIFNEQIRKFI